MSEPSRRRFLAGAVLVGTATVCGAGAAGALAGWFTTRARTLPVAAPPAVSVSAAAAILAAAVVRERALIAQLTPVGAGPSGSAVAHRIPVLLNDHSAHLDALLALVRVAGPGPAPVATTAGTPASPAASVLTTVHLRRWETVAAAAAAKDSAGLTGAAAVVLASISACEATHVAWLQ